jgi:hypothetical protein
MKQEKPKPPLPSPDYVLRKMLATPPAPKKAKNSPKKPAK